MSTLSKVIITLLAVTGVVVLFVGLEGQAEFLPWVGAELLLVSLIAFTVAKRQARFKGSRSTKGESACWRRQADHLLYFQR